MRIPSSGKKRFWCIKPFSAHIGWCLFFYLCIKLFWAPNTEYKRISNTNQLQKTKRTFMTDCYLQTRKTQTRGGATKFTDGVRHDGLTALAKKKPKREPPQPRSTFIQRLVKKKRYIKISELMIKIKVKF